MSMIDKQKLLEWISNRYDVSSHPADEDEAPERVAAWKAEAALMFKLKSQIEFGDFDAPFKGVHVSDGQNHTNAQFVELSLKYVQVMDHLSIAEKSIVEGTARSLGRRCFAICRSSPSTNSENR